MLITTSLCFHCKEYEVSSVLNRRYLWHFYTAGGGKDEYTETQADRLTSGQTDLPFPNASQKTLLSYHVVFSACMVFRL